MLKSRKLISIVAAVAMVFTMLSSFTFASAVTSDEVTKGITLTYEDCTTNGDGTQTIKVLVGYKDIAGVTSYAVRFDNLPTTITNMTGVSKVGGMEAAITESLATEHWASFGAMGVNVASTVTEGDLAELTFTASSELAIQPTITLTADTSYVYDNASPKVKNIVGTGEGKIPATSVTLAVDTAKETTDKARDAVDTSTVETPEELDPIVSVNKGITLTAGEIKDGETAGTYTYDVTVGYKDIAGVTSYAVRFDNLPASVTNMTGVTKVGGMEAAITESLATEHWASFGAMGVNVASTVTEGDLAVVTLTLNEKPTSDIQLTLTADTSYVYDNASPKVKNIVGTGEGKIPAANVNLVAPKAEEKTGKEVAMPLDSDKVVDETVGTTGESDYYIVADVVDADGNKVAYGAETYKAEVVYKDANGDEQKITLTEGQYKNLINGHLGAANLANVVEAAGINNMSDVVDKLKYVMYNDGLKVKAQLVQATADGNLIQDEGEGSAKPSQGDRYVASTAKLTKSKSQKATAGTKVTNTYTVTTGSKNGENYDFGTVTFKLTEESLEILPLAGVQISFKEFTVADVETVVTSPISVKDATAVELPRSADGKYTITFTPTAAGTVEYSLSYAGGYDINGEAVDPIKDTVTYTVSAAKSSTNGGSGSSSKDNTSSGGGAIASGLVDSGSSYLPNLGFDDLGDVTWAQTAINTLAAKKIVSGVGDNKFDPNAALTRAAYAQMLVNAIGHSTDSADTYFDDVPTDAWFYHNVAVASQLGIVSGFGDGTFRPNDLITREQMALMTQKAAVVMGKSLVGADVGTFTDDADIADWSRDAVYTLANAGIINGMGDGTFAPQANATRAQAAVIIYNAFVK